MHKAPYRKILTLSLTLTLGLSLSAPAAAQDLATPHKQVSESRDDDVWEEDAREDDVWDDSNSAPERKPGKRPKSPGADSKLRPDDEEILDDLFGDSPLPEKPKPKPKPIPDPPAGPTAPIAPAAPAVPTEKQASLKDSDARKWSGITGKRYSDRIRKTDRVTYLDGGITPPVSCDLIGDNTADLIFIHENQLTIVPFIPYGSDEDEVSRKISAQTGADTYTLPKNSAGKWKAACVKPAQGKEATLAVANAEKIYLLDRAQIHNRTAVGNEVPITATLTFPEKVTAFHAASPDFSEAGLVAIAGAKAFYFANLNHILQDRSKTLEAAKATKTWELETNDPNANVTPIGYVYQDKRTFAFGLPSKNVVYAISAEAPNGKLADHAVQIHAKAENGASAFGFSVVGISDVNNDEIDDFAVGAPEANSRTGAVAIIFGEKNISAKQKVTVDLAATNEQPVVSDEKAVGTLIRQTNQGRIGISLAYLQQYDPENPGALLIGRPDHEEHPGAILVSTSVLAKNWNFNLGLDSIPGNARAWFASDESSKTGINLAVAQPADSDAHLSAILIGDAQGKIDVWTADLRRQNQTTPKAEPRYPAPNSPAIPAGINPIDTPTQKRWVGDFADGFGSAIARGQCDVTGDGKPDLVLSSPIRDEWKFDPHYESSTVSHGWLPNVTGQIQVIPAGTPGGLVPNDSIITINGPTETQDPAADAAVGLSIACLGDVNGDKIDDFAFGSHTMGRVWVIYGGADLAKTNLDQLDPQRGFIVQMPHEFGAAGYHVTKIGDYNHDGFADIGFIVSNTPISRGLRGSYGTALIVAGGKNNSDLELIKSYDDPRVLLQIHTPQGTTLSQFVPVGDVNGDQLQDYVLADFNSPNAANQVTGKAWVVFGAQSAKTNVIDLSQANTSGYTLTVPDDASYRLGAGTSIAPLGDLNGDQFADFAIGYDGGQIENTTHGGVAIVYGSGEKFTLSQARQINPQASTPNSTGIAILRAAQPGTGFGWSVAAEPQQKLLAIGAWNEAADGAVYLLNAQKIPMGATDISDPKLAVKRFGTDAKRARFGRSVAFVGNYLQNHLTLAIGADGVVDNPAADEEGYSHAAHLLAIDLHDLLQEFGKANEPSDNPDATATPNTSVQELPRDNSDSSSHSDSSASSNSYAQGHHASAKAANNLAQTGSNAVILLCIISLLLGSGIYACRKSSQKLRWHS